MVTKNFTADSNICNNYMDLVQPRLSNVFLRDGTKPLLQPVLSYHKLDSEEHISITLWYWIHPGGGTPYMMGDTYVPLFWPPFLTLWVPNSIFLGCFFSSTNTKTIFWVQILTKFDLFGPKIPFSPRSFWVQFSVAHGTPPAIFGPPRENSTLFFQENIFENLVGKMLAIIYWPQYVYGCAPWGWYRLLVTANLYLFIFHIHKQLMFEY